MELRSVDPGSNRYRRYRLSVQFDLGGGGQLLVQWGRIGARLRSRVEHFASDDELKQRYDALIARRRNHSYVPLAANDAHSTDIAPDVAGPAPAGAALDTSTRFLALVQSNGYAGVFDEYLQAFIVRNTDLEFATPLARRFNARPETAESLLAAAG